MRGEGNYGGKERGEVGRRNRGGERGEGRLGGRGGRIIRRLIRNHSAAVFYLPSQMTDLSWRLGEYKTHKTPYTYKYERIRQ